MDPLRLMTLFQADPEGFDFGSKPTFSEDGQWLTLQIRVKTATLAQLGPEALAQIAGQLPPSSPPPQ